MKTLLEKIKLWLGPSLFVEPFQRATKIRHDGTAEWLFVIDKFQDWARDDILVERSHENYLWVQGKYLSYRA